MSAIQFIRSYSSHRSSCWEATCEPVYRNAETGQFLVPAEKHAPDSKIIKATALQGYALAEYREGLDKDPTYLPWIEQYVTHFRTVAVTRYPSLFGSEVSSLTLILFISPNSNILLHWRRTVHPTTNLTMKSRPPAALKDLPSLKLVPVEVHDVETGMLTPPQDNDITPLYER